MAGECDEVKAVSVLIVLKTDRHAIKLLRKPTPGVSAKTPGGHQTLQLEFNSAFRSKDE
jgi:hypothetical protein